MRQVWQNILVLVSLSLVVSLTFTYMTKFMPIWLSLLVDLIMPGTIICYLVDIRESFKE